MKDVATVERWYRVPMTTAEVKFAEKRSEKSPAGFLSEPVPVPKLQSVVEKN
jgi:hypothetical protein